ncbi:hypothetical protein ABK040_012038 [Willaertia magna]
MIRTGNVIRRKLRDYVKSFMSVDGKFRVSLIDSSDCLKSFIDRFHLNPDTNNSHKEATILMGKSISASCLLSSLLKGEERIKLEIFCQNTHPTIERILAESIQVGEVRGYVLFKDNKQQHEIPVPEELQNVVESSVFSVSKILMEKSKPVVSHLPLSEDLTTDFKNFFTLSEQIPTASTLVCQHDIGSNPISYGVLIQRLPLPVTSDHLILNDDLAGVSEIQEQLNNYQNLLDELPKKIHSKTDIHEHLFYNFFVTEQKETVRWKPIDFFCRCSKKQLLDAVTHVGLEELLSMRQELMEKEQNSYPSNCEFCNTIYELTLEDINMLISQYEKGK